MMPSSTAHPTNFIQHVTFASQFWMCLGNGLIFTRIKIKSRESTQGVVGERLLPFLWQQPSGELGRKKQSDVMHFLLRVRCWRYRQLPRLPRAPRPTQHDKARRLGYQAKQGYDIYRIRVRHGGRERPVPKGAPYGQACPPWC